MHCMSGIQSYAQILEKMLTIEAWIEISLKHSWCIVRELPALRGAIHNR